MQIIENVEQFSTYVSGVEKQDGYVRPTAFAIGVRRKRGDVTLDVTYPVVNFEESYGTAAVIAKSAGICGSENGFVVIDLSLIHI